MRWTRLTIFRQVGTRRTPLRKKVGHCRANYCKYCHHILLPFTIHYRISFYGKLVESTNSFSFRLLFSKPTLQPCSLAIFHFPPSFSLPLSLHSTKLLEHTNPHHLPTYLLLTTSSTLVVACAFGIALRSLSQHLWCISSVHPHFSSCMSPFSLSLFLTLSHSLTHSHSLSHSLSLSLSSPPLPLLNRSVVNLKQPPPHSPVHLI